MDCSLWTGSLFGEGVKKRDFFTLSPNGQPVHRLMDLNPLTEMPTSGDLKSGDSLFFTTPPPPPDKLTNNNNNNNNLHLYSANLYMNIIGCTSQYCYIKFMLKVTKAWENGKPPMGMTFDIIWSLTWRHTIKIRYHRFDARNNLSVTKYQQTFPRNRTMNNKNSSFQLKREKGREKLKRWFYPGGMVTHIGERVPLPDNQGELACMH